MVKSYVKKKNNKGVKRPYKAAKSRTLKRYRRKMKHAGGLRVMRNTIAMLSPCAKDYIEVLANPFEPKLMGAPCVPDYRSVPSSKFYLRARGTFSPSGGTGGTGVDHKLAYVALNPWRPNNSTSPVAPAIIYTKGGSGAGTDNVTPVTSAVSGVFADYLDTTLTATDFAADGTANKFRVVSAGLRVSYAGQWDSLKGTVALFRHPSNNRNYLYSANSNAGPTFADLLKFDECGYGALTHGDHLQVYYAPIDNNDFEYEVQDPSATASVPIMAVVIKDGPTDASYTYEAIVWYEAVGPTMRGETPSHVDLKGLGIAMSGDKKQEVGQTPAAAKAKTTVKIIEYI